MEALIDNFWKALDTRLHSLANQLLAEHDDFKFYIGKSSNSVFPLRAYLTILREDDGDELSITVDIKNRENGLLIDSDIVGEEGVVVANGPSLELQAELPKNEAQVKIDEWFVRFDHLIEEKSADVEVAIKALG